MGAVLFLFRVTKEITHDNTKTVWRKPSDKGPGERISINVKINCCGIHTRLMLLKSVSEVQIRQSDLSSMTVRN